MVKQIPFVKPVESKVQDCTEIGYGSNVVQAYSACYKGKVHAVRGTHRNTRGLCQHV